MGAMADYAALIYPTDNPPYGFILISIVQFQTQFLSYPAPDTALPPHYRISNDAPQDFAGYPCPQ